jgi:putative DNA-invertase from lambdoid prophage Rac
MQVFGYCRVSTTEQADEGSSLASQRQQITGYAMMKGWTITEMFVEAGVSGSIPLADRPEGRRLLEAISKGAVVITAKLDRMFRSAADALVTLEEVKDQGVALHMIDLGGDVTGNGISKMVFTILAAVAEGERDRIRERIRDAKRHLTAQGVFSGGKRPFGFDIFEDGEISRKRCIRDFRNRMQESGRQTALETIACVETAVSDHANMEIVAHAIRFRARCN